MNTPRRSAVWRALGTWLPYVLPWWILIPAMAVVSTQHRIGADLHTLHEAEALSMSAQDDLIRSAIVRLTNDIRLVARIAASAEARDPRTAGDTWAAFMRDFLAAHPDYAQARWLDGACREQVRLDARPDGVHRAAENALQDKSQRSYCAPGRTLAPARSALTHMEPNVEHGRIVEPIEPTLRVISRSFNASGEAIGIMILNYNAGALLDALARAAPQGALVDADGRWLHAPGPLGRTGFILDGTALPLPQADPETWQQVHRGAAPFGQFITASGLWSARLIAPSQDDPAVDAPRWYVLSQVPAARIAALRDAATVDHARIAGIALLVLTALSTALAHAQLKRQHATAALARANADLSATIERLEHSRADLVRSEKLSSLGVLVAGIAHEVNSPLGAAMLAADALDTQLRALEQAYANGLRHSDMRSFSADHQAGLGVLHDNLRRAAVLLRQFQQVAADRATATRDTFILAELVQDVLAVMGSTLRHSGHTIEVDVPADLTLDSYPGPLGQILQNLLGNAVMHAYADGQTGRIRIQAQCVRQQLTLSVIDDGRGIAPAERERVWDPFVTTAQARGGTGLGLHICQQLASAVLGGHIAQVDTATPGTHMRLTIPLEAPQEAPPAATKSGT